MWPFRKKIPQRRLEVRKSIPSGHAGWWKRLREAGGLGGALLAVVFLIALAVMDVFPTDRVPYRRGQYISRDIHGRVAFRVLSLEGRERLRRDAENETPGVYKLDKALMDEIFKTLKRLPDQLKTATQPSETDDLLVKRFDLKPNELRKLRRTLWNPDGRKSYDRNVEQLVLALSGTYLVRSRTELPNYPRDAREAQMVRANTRRPTPISELIALTESRKVSSTLDELTKPFKKTVGPHIAAYLRTIVAERGPIYVYDELATQAAIEDTKRRIETNPPDAAYKVYPAGELLVRQSRRGPRGAQKIEGLSEAELALLTEEHKTYLEVQGHNAPWRKWLQVFAKTAIYLLIVLLLVLYIGRYQPSIAENVWSASALGLLLLLMLGICKIVLFVPNLNPYSALFAAVMGTMILTIAYDQRFALMLAIILSVLIVLQIHQNFTMLVVMLSGVGAIVFQLGEIRTRSKLLETSGIAAGIVFAIVCAFGITQVVPWKFFLLDAVWAGGVVLLGGMVVQGVLPLIEGIFRVATSMTLLECCDASKPLLKRLAMEAPGTYNHSLQLGAMCEAAADAIGARGLLARVGAYYHDIGKVNKPDYFVENQADSPSKHEKLSPAMSLLIIIAHVKDGLEMAREYALPQVLHEFIATHHGTTLVQYFYHAATEQRKGEKDRPPEESEFRYAGPKPHMREAAILMLGDAAETSVRAMSEPTPGRIENQVHTMVDRRLMDGQLDECEMTLKDVHKVEASLVKSLCSIYHARLAYPTPTGEKPSAAETHPEKKTSPKPEPQDQNQIPSARDVSAT